MIISVVFSINTHSARPIKKCHQYLKYEKKAEEYWLSFNWKKFEEKLQELYSKNLNCFELSTIGTVGQYPIYKIVTKKFNSNAKSKVLVTAGIHGTEPLGVTSGLDLLDAYCRDSNLQKKVDLVLFPALNPWGLENFKRRDSKDVDINRSFGGKLKSESAIIVMNNLRGQEFDLALDLHGAPKKNYHFIIQGKDNNNVSLKAVSAVQLEKLLMSDSGNYPDNQDDYWLLKQGVASNIEGRKTMKAFAATELNASNSYTIEYPGMNYPEQAHRLNLRLVLSIIHHFTNI